MSCRTRPNAIGRVTRAAGARPALGIALAATLTTLAIGMSRGQGAESWQVLLAHQLKEQQRCELSEVLFVREIKVGGKLGLEGRIRCADTREYDFQRDQENERFILRKCEPVSVC